MAPTYTIDDEKLTISDLVKLQKAGDDLSAQLDVLRKVVVVADGTVDDIPAKHYRAIVRAVLAGVTGDSLGN